MYSMERQVSFDVRGLPAPQGSKRAFRNKHTGRIHQVESSKNVAPWRSDVRDAAMREMRDEPPLEGPVKLVLMFRLPRPKGHYRTGANADLLREAAPHWPAGKPDLDKLARAVLDALTGLVIVDDSAVVQLMLRKAYADPKADLVDDRHSGVWIDAAQAS